MRFGGLFIVVLAFCQVGYSAANEDQIRVPGVLQLGPLALNLDAAQPSRDEELRGILVERLGDMGWPDSGQTVRFLDKTYGWRESPAPIDLSEMVEGEVLVVSFNMESSRFSRGTLSVTWDGECQFYLDGKKVDGSSKAGFPISVPTGSHRVLALLWGGADSEFSVAFDSDVGSPEFHLRPYRRVSPELLFHTPIVRDVDVSPDGDRVALRIRGYDTQAGEWSERLEIRELDEASIQRQWTEDIPSEIAWHPKGHGFAYVRGDDLYWEHAGQIKRLIAAKKGISNLAWARDGQSVFFDWESKAKPREDGMKRYRALEDRWTTWRNRYHVFQVDAQTGLVRQLTHGTVSHRRLDIDPAGTRLLIASSPVDYSRPPHTKTVLEEHDIATGSIEELGTFWTFDRAAYGPEGIYIVAGPTFQDGLGIAPGLNETPNDYDGQLYLFDPQTKRATPLSLDFDPSIGALRVAENGDVLIKVVERQHEPLYWYRKASNTFEKVPSPATVIRIFDCAQRDASIACWAGTAASMPQRVFVLKGGEQQPQILLNPGGQAYDQIRLGRVEAFDFENRRGETIEGRMYTPPDFDDNARYPLIVYYYGGTSTVDESFTGRYPFHLWAAHGYVIYVLQPTGTVGYGQVFSARHVNAWGTYTADDIIDGTKRFLKQHPFVDPDRVGCAGASYGGFMTMYLITQTDLFAAAISHAGISTLTGYWGKGWWGYLYSGVASRESFPWNNKGLYVDQSPLFFADRITTPLLLLHGDSDTNVPPEQSHLMFTALKLLGKDVELIEVGGENHLIMDHDKRLIWWDTFLAWFDKHLKDQDAWWSHLYPEEITDE